MSDLFGPTFNFGGIASGLDTNAIVSQLMAIEGRSKTRLTQQKTVETARQTALQDIQTRLRNLRSAVAGLGDAGTWGDQQSVSSADATRVAVRRTAGAAPGGYAVQVDGLARAAQMTQGTGVTSAAAADTLRITVGAKTVDVVITAGDSLATIAERINGTSDTPVFASVINDKLILSGKTTGLANTITVADGDTGNGTDLAAALGFTQTQAPRNADFWVDGTHYTDRTSNIVTDVLPGLEITLKATTTGTVGLTVGQPGADTDTIKAKVQAFVDQYNSTIEFIQGKLDEKKVANPTTQAEREKGLLRGDAGLSILLSRLRAGVSDVFSGRPTDLDQLSEVGITTGKSTGSGAVDPNALAGKLTLDATKLTEKLASSFGDVKALFTNVTGAYATEGLGQRLTDLIAPWTDGNGTDRALLASRITASQDAQKALTDRMADLDRRLALREKSLRAQFTAMETALSAAQSQSSWLSGQLSRL